VSNFGYGKAQEAQYAKNLRKIAKDIDLLCKQYTDAKDLQFALESYAQTLDPVAEKYAQKMISDASKRNLKAWIATGKAAGKDFSALVKNSSTGIQVATHLNAQVEMIKTLPLNSAKKAQQLAIEAVAGSLRADDIVGELLKIGSQSYYEATRVARTEIAKTNAAITQSRAAEVGVDAYIWRSVGDSNSRESHLEMDGELCNFYNPPIVDGEPLNPGEIYNCRCFADPVITS
jgi:SPP1 gp7 family putative phage head morphogenesis protein